ncbi:MAG TPA: glycosyltransferase family 87 protein [Jatrophihabitans sp.]|nr:glycosyltransferase family 87 protein [Jatrophihabitans sp.]
MASATTPARALRPRALGTPRPQLGLPASVIAEGRPAIVLRWVLSRALVLTIMVFAHESDVTGDVTYYATSLHQLFHGAGLHNTLQEYPLPVLLVLLPPFLLAVGNQLAFTFLFALSMLAVDAAFTALLWFGDGRRRGDATNLWLWFVPALGPLAYFRFDLVPAVLAGGAVLAAIRRPALAGSLTALGAALKLWPAVMLPTFLIRRGDRRAVLAGFLSTGILVGGVALALGGLRRTLSPLHWQSARGLQIESVPATPLMLARAVHPVGVWTVRVSKYKAFEIFGAGSRLLITVSTVLTALGGLLLVSLWLRALRVGRPSAETLGWLFLATALIVTVTNKTLSPQYLLWLGGPVAALAVRAPADNAVRTFGRVLMVTAVATQLTFPIGYNALLKTHSLMPLVAVDLALRNALLLWLAWFSVRQVWRQTARPAVE